MVSSEEDEVVGVAVESLSCTVATGAEYGGIASSLLLQYDAIFVFK
jgi:hypothetical protein